MPNPTLIYVRLLVLFMVATLLLSCSSTRTPGDSTFRISVPKWMTQPSSGEQLGTPVEIGMTTPHYLKDLSEQYGLPGWIVYGVIRCLGTEELHAWGTYRVYTIADDLSESTVIFDDIRYDVPARNIHAVLSELAGEYRKADDYLSRRKVLDPYVHRRMGNIVLFRLDSQGESQAAQNLLLGSGYSKDPMDVFFAGGQEDLPEIGWSETSSDYIVTLVGDFRYHDLVGSFRKVEEEAIYELCKTLIVDLQTIIKDGTTWYKMGAVETSRGFAEEISKEEVSVNLLGVRVLRRIIDVDNAACIAVVKVPKSGIFIH